jgi:hypothetical protein
MLRFFFAVFCVQATVLESVAKFARHLQYLDISNRQDLDDAAIARILHLQLDLESFAVAGTGAGGLTFMMLGQTTRSQRSTSQHGQTCLTKSQTSAAFLTSSSSTGTNAEGIGWHINSSRSCSSGETIKPMFGQTGVVSLTALTRSYSSGIWGVPKLRRLDLSGCKALQSTKPSAVVFGILRTALGRLVLLKGKRWLP